MSDAFRSVPRTRRIPEQSALFAETAKRRSPNRSRTNDCNSSSSDAVIGPVLSPRLPLQRDYPLAPEPHRAKQVLRVRGILLDGLLVRHFGQARSAHGTIAALHGRSKGEAPGAASCSSSSRCRRSRVPCESCAARKPAFQRKQGG